MSSARRFVEVSRIWTNRVDSIDIPIRRAARRRRLVLGGECRPYVRHHGSSGIEIPLTYVEGP